MTKCTRCNEKMKWSFFTDVYTLCDNCLKLVFVELSYEDSLSHDSRNTIELLRENVITIEEYIKYRNKILAKVDRRHKADLQFKKRTLESRYADNIEGIATVDD